MKLKNITEDEFEDLDDQDTFNPIDEDNRLDIAIAIGSNEIVIIEELGPKIYEIIENKIIDGNIFKIWPMASVGNMRIAYPTIQRKLQNYQYRYLGAIDTIIDKGYYHKDTIEILEQLKDIYKINENTVWTTDADYTLEHIKKHIEKMGDWTEWEPIRDEFQ